MSIIRKAFGKVPEENCLIFSSETGEGSQKAWQWIEEAIKL